MAETVVADRHAPGEARAHQFDDAEQQRDAATMGMWVFLVTEIMFFGGLFLTYVVYRALYGERDLWIRPRAVFLDTVMIDGSPQPRFRRLTT